MFLFLHVPPFFSFYLTIVNFLLFSTFSLSSFSPLFSFSSPYPWFRYISITTPTFSFFCVSFVFFPSQIIIHIFILVIQLTLSTLFASSLTILFLSLSSSSFSYPSLKSTCSSSKGKVFEVKEIEKNQKKGVTKKKWLRSFPLIFLKLVTYHSFSIQKYYKTFQKGQWRKISLKTFWLLKAK